MKVTLNQKFINAISQTAFVAAMTLFAPTAFTQSSDLPDDVNYVKYSQIFVQAKNISEPSREATEKLRAQANLDGNNLVNAQNSLKQMKSSLEENGTIFFRAQQELPKLLNQNAQLSNQVNALATQAAQLDAEIRSLQIDIANKEAQINAASVANNSAIQRLNSESANLQTLETNVASLESRLSSAQQKKTTLEAEIQKLNSELSAPLENKKALESQKAEQEKMSADIDPQIISVQKSLDDLKALNSTEPSILESIAKIETSLQSMKKIKADANAKIVELISQIGTIDSQMAASQNALDSKKQELSQVNILITDGPNQLSSMKIERDKSRTRLSISQGAQVATALTLKKLVDSRNSQVTLLNNKAFQRSSIVQQLDDTQRSTAQIQARISTVRQAQRDSAAQVDDLNNNIAQLEPQIPGLTAKASNSQAAFDAADAETRKLEQDTSAKLNKFSSVKSAYDKELSDLAKKGADQGKINGALAGTAQGKIDGNRVGTEDGLALGKEQGLVDGFNRGQADGQVQGKADGYKDGFENPDNIERGRQAGIDQGKLNARREAMTTTYVQSLANLKTNRMGMQLSNQVELNNLQDQLFSAQNRQAEQLISTGDLAGFSVQARNENRQSINAGIPVFTQAIAGQVVLGKVTTQSHLLSLKSDRANANCEARHIDFTNACLSDYDKQFVANYSLTYPASHKSAYDLAKEENRILAFKQNKDVRYKEGRDPVYAAYFKSFQLKGAQDAESNGFVAGLTEGFNAVINTERNSALRKAQTDHDFFFRNNPGIRLRGAHLIKVASDFNTPFSDITAGDTLSLKLDLANVGEMATKKGDVTVRLEAMTSDVATENVTNQIVSQPAMTLAKIRNAAIAKVTNNAVGGIAKLKLTVNYPDGVSESQILEVQTKAFFIADLDLSDMNLRPNATTAGIRRGDIGGPNTIRFKVGVRNLAPIQAQGDITVELSNPDLSWKVQKANLGRIQANQMGQAEMVYTLSAQRRGKQFPVTITVRQDQTVIKTQTVVIEPK